MSDIFQRIGVSPAHPYSPDKFLFKFLRRQTDNWPKFNVNGSIIPQYFEYICPDNTAVYIHDIIMMMSCVDMTWENFGNIPNLTNGITLKCYDKDNSVLLDFLDGELIRKTRNFVWYDGEFMTIGRNTPLDISVVKMKIPLFNLGCVMQLNAGQKIKLGVHDDLSTINVGFCALMGIKYYA